MASRNVVQQQNGGAVLGANKQKMVAGADKKNRRALGDIGNLVTVDANALPQVSRPLTRRFCAQLLANAQNGAVENQKVLPDGVLPEKRAVVRNPAARKKAATKPRPEEVIEISPDTHEKMAEKEHLREKKKTLTSTLTARSKAACGLSNVTRKTVNIDALDVDNHLAVVEYIEDMYSYYKSAESEGWPSDYMDFQPEITERMRAILIDWLVQVHGKLDLSPETLYLTINIVDRYLNMKITSRRELQLVGLGALLIASKYEEIWAPEVHELVQVSDRTYSHTQILVMEKQILGELEWNLTVPTTYVFLTRFIKASLTGSDVENTVYFLAELGMMNYEIFKYSPTMIAASAVYAARCTLNKVPFWNETLKLHTGFSEPQLMDCAKLLVSYHSLARDHKLRGIYKKYSSSELGGVAILKPAESLSVFTLSNF